jgi:hypothetical protein
MFKLERNKQEKLFSRISDASTDDANFSSDEESRNCCISLNPIVVAKVFLDISYQQKEEYRELNNRLESLYNTLNDEIDPVNIREELTLIASNIKLNEVSSSNLSLRRSNKFNKLQ